MIKKWLAKLVNSIIDDRKLELTAELNQRFEQFERNLSSSMSNAVRYETGVQLNSIRRDVTAVLRQVENTNNRVVWLEDRAGTVGNQTLQPTMVERNDAALAGALVSEARVAGLKPEDKVFVAEIVRDGPISKDSLLSGREDPTLKLNSGDKR